MKTLNDIVIPTLVNGSVYALVALGFNLLERSTRMLNFAQGDLIMWAAMAPIVTGTLWGFPPWLALLSGVVAAVGFGLIIEKVALRPFIGRSEDYTWILATLGCGIILEQLASEPFGGQDQAFPFSFSRTPLTESLLLSAQQILVIAGAVFVGIAVYLILERSRLGRQVTAVGTDPEGAIVLGISLRRISQVVMILSALSAAVVGLTVAPLLLVSPTFGFSLTFIGFAAAAIGGLGSVRGSFLGGYVVALVIQLTAVYWTTSWTNTMVFGVLVAVYAFRPWGVFGHRPARVV